MKETERPPLYLTILRKGDTNIIDVVEVGTLIPRSETEVSNAFLEELVTEVTRLAAPGYNRNEGPIAQEGATLPQPTALVQDLQRIGGLLFSHLLTETAQKRLRSAEPGDLYLRLDEQLVHLPWELCFDGRDFLAAKFRVGRQVITSQRIPQTVSARDSYDGLRVLLIADPTETLPEASNEAEHLCTLLDIIPGVDVSLLGGKSIRKVSLLAALQAHDIVHFAGHSYYDPHHPEKSGWRLQGDVLTASELSRLNRPPLLVFSNSCQAGATASWEATARYDNQAFGIGSAFLLAGVKNYIGAFWVVHDEESVLFATTFYQKAAAGLSLGEALLLARQEVIRQRGWRGLTWASYMLYGDPAFTLLPALEESPPIPAEAPSALVPSLPTIALDDDQGAREAVRRYEYDQCARLDVLGRSVPLEAHYQALPLLREVKRERLPRQKPGNGNQRRQEEEFEHEPGGLREVDILRWEEELREELVAYKQTSLLEVFHRFRAIVKEATNDIPRFVVLGPPGSGKTTLVQYIGWQAARGELRTPAGLLLPVRVRLREWEAWTAQARTTEHSLPHYLTYSYAHLSPPPSVDHWRRWLQQGEVVLLLDGLDEIEGRSAFLIALQHLLEAYVACPTVATCRTVTFEQHRRACAALPLFTLSSFESSHRDAYIHAFPASSQGRYDPETLISHLARTPALSPLAANPFLLSILCYVADSATDGSLPTTRSALYQHAIKQLLAHRAQRVEARYPGAEPTVDEKAAILERTALHLFAHNSLRLTFSGQDLGQALRQALKAEGYGEASAPWANALRVDLSHNSGILRGNDTYGFFFLHLTMQEFLAARAIARHVNVQGWDAPLALADRAVSIRHLVDRKAWDPRWQEVIMLLAGQLGDPAPLFQLLLQEREDDLFGCRLALAALCLSEASAQMNERHADMVDRITAAAISLWRQHEQRGSVVAVAHVTRALPALGRLNGRLEGTPLLKWLCLQARDARGDVRAGAIKALGHMGESLVYASGPEPLSTVVGAAFDQDLLVRVEAVEALRRIGTLALGHISVLLTLTQAALYDPDGLVRAGAAGALEQLRKAAVHNSEVRAAIDAALRDDTPQVRTRAQRLQQRLEGVLHRQFVAQTVNAELKVFSHEVANTARQSGNAVAHRPEEMLDVVKTALNDVDPLRRSEAVKTLEQVGIVADQHSEVVSTLLRAMHDADGGVRSCAVKLLKTLGPAVLQRGEALSALKAVALHDRNSNVRAEAIEALGLVEEIAVQNPGVLIALVHGVKYDKEGKVRARAAEALGRLGKVAARRAETFAALVTALHDADDEVRYRAAEALECIMSQGVRLFRHWWRKVEGKKVEELARL